MAQMLLPSSLLRFSAPPVFCGCTLRIRPDENPETKTGCLLLVNSNFWVGDFVWKRFNFNS